MPKRVLVLVAVLCTIFNASSAKTEETRTPPRFHSHNDYEQTHPLFDALSYGIHSVEADIWYSDGQWPGLLDGGAKSTAPMRWRVSHMGFGFAGTLEQLYLKPLQQLVRANGGSVFGDGKTFYLWLEFKQSDEFLGEVLHRKLAEYASILYLGGPVQIILTGSEKPKRAYNSTYSDLAVMIDTLALYKSKAFTHFNEIKPTTGWGWYSLAWSNVVDWDGQGTMSEKQRRQLRNAVAIAHAQKRRLRIFHSPDKKQVWDECFSAGVDLVSVDNLPQAYRYLPPTFAPSYRE